MLLKVIFLLPLFSISAKEHISSRARECQSNRLVIYGMKFTTFWSRDLFPKHYPEWRPQAQWSKLVGCSHNSSISVFKLGTKASQGLKHFAEVGNYDTLISVGQGEGGVLDKFDTDSISTGAGKSSSQFMVDDKHSQVSLLSKIIPSPDWFVGLDSLDLCQEGKWTEKIEIDLDPLDAGTDSGMTFTAPNWPTEPQEDVYKLTDRRPSHMAASFYYSPKSKLPTIARIEIYKVREYQLTDGLNSQESSDGSIIASDNVTLENDIPLLIRKSINANEDNFTAAVRDEMFEWGELASTSTPNIQLEDQETVAGTLSNHPRDFNMISLGKDAVTKDLHKRSKVSRRTPKKERPARDCIVGAWSAWSDCSETCDIGERKRTRKILKKSKRGGKACPPLVETAWCGTARSCNRKYFKW